MAKKSSILRCSFCDKSQKEVDKIVAGPSVYICDECIELCNNIIEEEREKDKPEETPTKLLKPKQIKQILDQLDRKRLKGFYLLRSITTTKKSTNHSNPAKSSFTNPT